MVQPLLPQFPAPPPQDSGCPYFLLRSKRRLLGSTCLTRTGHFLATLSLSFLICKLGNAINTSLQGSYKKNAWEVF